jgi:hypothetical protein
MSVALAPLLIAFSAASVGLGSNAKGRLEEEVSMIAAPAHLHDHECSEACCSLRGATHDRPHAADAASFDGR